MRKNALLCALPLLLAGLFPTLIQAQFQPPNPDELKMTADPKAPGADAVYLEIKEIDSDPLHYRHYYARIKVLTEKGKDLATVELPYLRGNFKINQIAARTIHPDGTIVPLEGRPEDLMTSKTGDTEVERKVFTLPSVTVGSVLEYQYDIGYPENQVYPPFWEIQQKYFVHTAHYEYSPPKQFTAHNSQGTNASFLTDSKGHFLNSLIWWKVLPPGVDVVTSLSGSYSLDLTDIPPAPDEAWAPPSDSILYKVRFNYETTNNAGAFWIEAAKDWGKDVDHFAEPTKPIQKAVASLVSSDDPDIAKARKLYDAVEALNNTDYTRARTSSEMNQLKLKAANRAADVWAQKSGSSDEIAMLYLSMLRAAGVTAYAARVSDREYRIFDTSNMNLDQLDDTLVIVAIDGKEIFLDPGEKMCPFGMLNWRHTSAAGLRESAVGMEIDTTPAPTYTQNSIERVGALAIDSHGGVSGQIRIIMGGQAALQWRQFALENNDDEVKKSFDRDLQSEVPEGVEAHLDHFLSMDQVDANLMAIVNVKGTLGTATAKRLLLPAFFFETRGNMPFVKEEKRVEPIDMHYGENVIDQITYLLPQGMTVEGAPKDQTDSWPGHAIYDVKVADGTGSVTVTRTLGRAFTFLKAADYQDLRGFYQKVATSDQQEVVLSTEAPAAAKGN